MAASREVGENLAIYVAALIGDVLDLADGVDPCW
jgi:hypothetical protein